MQPFSQSHRLLALDFYSIKQDTRLYVAAHDEYDRVLHKGRVHVPLYGLCDRDDVHAHGVRPHDYRPHDVRPPLHDDAQPQFPLLRQRADAGDQEAFCMRFQCLKHHAHDHV